MKNVDKIRKLSDEELANFILDIVNGHCNGCPCQGVSAPGVKCPIDPEWDDKVGCKERVLQWFNAEVDWSAYIPFKENY